MDAYATLSFLILVYSKRVIFPKFDTKYPPTCDQVLEGLDMETKNKIKNTTLSSLLEAVTIAKDTVSPSVPVDNPIAKRLNHMNRKKTSVAKAQDHVSPRGVIGKLLRWYIVRFDQFRFVEICHLFEEFQKYVSGQQVESEFFRTRFLDKQIESMEQGKVCGNVELRCPKSVYGAALSSILQQNLPQAKREMQLYAALSKKEHSNILMSKVTEHFTTLEQNNQDYIKHMLDKGQVYEALELMDEYPINETAELRKKALEMIENIQ